MPIGQQQPQQSPAVARFVTEASQLAQRLGLKSLVIMVRDPTTGEGLLYASPGGKEDLRSTAADKFGLSDSEAETGWPS